MCKLLFALGLGSCVTLGMASVPAAQNLVSLQYKFTTGQSLRYEATRSMTVESTVSGTTQKVTSETIALRQWKVLEVDEKGNARLAMSILRVKVNAVGADAKKFAFDTEKDEKNPLAAIIGKPLAEVKLSSSGMVLEIKESDTPGAGQFVSHIRSQLYPFPPTGVAIGTRWQHDVDLPLPPPLGTGEQIRVRQTFQLEKVTDSVASVNLRSATAEEIKDKAMMRAIAQFLPSGRMEFDLSRGVVRSLELTLDQTVNEFAGKDSVEHTTGTYRETLRDDVAGTAPSRK